MGGILIAHRTAELIRDRIPAVERGTIAIKGLADEVAVYEVPVEAEPAVSEPTNVSTQARVMAHLPRYGPEGALPPWTFWWQFLQACSTARLLTVVMPVPPVVRPVDVLVWS